MGVFMLMHTCVRGGMCIYMRTCASVCEREILCVCVCIFVCAFVRMCVCMCVL